MSEDQIKKILSDLENSNDKIVILALMYIPRLSTEISHTNKSLHLLKHSLENFQDHGSADISFLSAKAKNFLLRNWPELSNYKINEQAIDQNLDPDKQIRDTPKNIDTQENTQFEPSETEVVDTPNLDEWIAQLKHQDPRVRSSAIEVCSSKMELEESQQYLIPLMQDENNRVRANAIVALKHLPTKDLSSSLKHMLESPRISMRESGIWALSKLKPDKHYLNFLFKALYDPYRDIRIRAIKALSLYAEKSVVIQMKRLLQDPDKQIVREANNTLELIGNKYVNQSRNFQKNTESYGSIENIDKKSILMPSEYLDIDKQTTEHSQFEDITPLSTTRKLNRIHHKIAMQQKLDMIEVSGFFNDVNCDEISPTERRVDYYWESPHPSQDILNWLPEGYLPERYSQIKNNESESAMIRQKISELLVQIGRRSFAYQSNCQEPNVKLAMLIIKLTKLNEKAKTIQEDTSINTTKKASLRLQLNRASRETLIKLGRATLKQFNLKNIEFKGLKESQMELNKMVTELSYLNKRPDH